MPTAKGQAVHCLVLEAQPAASRLCGLHQPLPSGPRLRPDSSSHWCLASNRQQSRSHRNRFPQFDSRDWVGPAGLFLTRISTWLLSIAIPSSGASSWVWGSPRMHAHTRTKTPSPRSAITASSHILLCMSHACTPGMYLRTRMPTISMAQILCHPFRSGGGTGWECSSFG